MLTASLLLLLSSATAQMPVRGVKRADWPAYAAADGFFQCRDSMAMVPIDQLNDDYCDCPDGSDEPGTSACPDSTFFCLNKGFKSKVVFSAVVNDGVCDCCDGSDEWASGQCENECAALGAMNKAKAQERARLVAQGYDIATQWAARGEAALQSTKAELDALNLELEGKRRELTAIDERKQAAEEVEQRLQEEHRAKKEVEAEAARLQKEAEAAEAAAAAEADGTVASAGEEVPKAPAPKMEPPTETEAAAATEEVAAEREGDPADELPDAGEDATPPNPDDFKAADYEIEGEEDDYAPEDDHALGEEDEEDDQPPAGGGDAAQPTEDPLPTDPEAEKLRTEHREAQTAIDKLVSKERELQELINQDFGPQRQFEPLQHECFDAPQGEWIYTLCPYKDAKQKGKHGGGATDLGRWERWSNSHKTMEFKNGQACWNGPIRSLTVNVRCGGENKLLKVEEPEVCKYTAEFESPAACTEEDARLAQQEVESCDAGLAEE